MRRLQHVERHRLQRDVEVGIEPCVDRDEVVAAGEFDRVPRIVDQRNVGIGGLPGESPDRVAHRAGGLVEHHLNGLKIQ